MKLKLDKDEYIYPCQKGYCVTFDDGKNTPYLQWTASNKIDAQKKYDIDKEINISNGVSYSDVPGTKIIKIIVLVHEWR